MVKNVCIMWLFKIKLLLLLLICGFIANAQVIVKDTLFAKELCNVFPSAMDASCKIITRDTNNITPIATDVVFGANSKGLTNISELRFFPEIEQLFVSENELVELPDLSNFPNLKILAARNNKLEIAPNINYVGNEKLNIVRLWENNISSLPGWDKPNSTIDSIGIYNNNLSYIPTFEGYTSLKWFKLDNNYLGFKHLLPLQKHPYYNSTDWRLFPQKYFDFSEDLTLTEGETIDLPVPENYQAEGNIYYLFKVGETTKDSTLNNFITVKALTDLDGRYRIRIKNSNFSQPEAYIDSKAFEINIKAPPVAAQEKNIALLSPNGDGFHDTFFIGGEGEFSIFSLSGELKLKGSLPFLWNGKDMNGNVVRTGLHYIQTESSVQKILLSY